MVNEQLVQDAVDLFIDTLPLENMDAEDPMFNKLYDKECQLYVLLGQMTEEDGDEYRIAVKYIK
jgi:hypothetical protein